MFSSDPTQEIKPMFTKALSNAKNLSGDKELVQGYKVVACVNGEFVEFVECIDCRVWMGRSRNASTVYASIWIGPHTRLKDDEGYRFRTSGYGTAGGYGYDKPSAAIYAAIRNAGVEIDHFGGAGESATMRALEEITKALGYRKFHVVRY